MAGGSFAQQEDEEDQSSSGAEQSEDEDEVWIDVADDDAMGQSLSGSLLLV